ncbi:sensor histidine kinase [Actinoalloteichus hymeniacidonis]|uniref:Signal transduction histidine kinase n=1 Tax=Actinoalloteichus hymeniacidonis TaxID=340345 RepID=A0AAC9HSL4_9PSEU|nr:sensor histidine kinase [Actinoalloteichus hymeniacidonis]AOS64584.1 signal transduction histidine kinase [Actinoalloteichus hymeniacidonis]MBB5907344.1 signal transduction histidine kinase [Actinoalloteichus hymeniacidonis]
MEPHALARPLRVLRVCLHLLMLGLLGLAAVRVVIGDGPHAASVVTASVLMAAVYVAGPLLPKVSCSDAAAAVWLAALGLVWLVLLWLTPDGVWLAFPLFFLQLHLLPGWWGLPVVGVTAVLAIAGFGWHQETFSIAAVIGPALGAAVAVATVLGYQALYAESEQRRRLIEQLTEARSELAAAERSAGVLAERERLAREIHDTLAQGLSSIQLLLRAAERALPDRVENAEQHVRQARTEAQHNLAEARRFVHALTPPDLESGSLPVALERLCATTAERTGLAVHFHLDAEPVALPTPYEVALLRIAQSALANTAQHAGASRAEVTLSYMDTRVTLDVVDDGVGFEPESPAAAGSVEGGFGLAAMRARARALGGRLSIESAPGRGTALAVSFARHDEEAE